MATVGRALLILALVVALYGIAASIYGAIRGRDEWIASGRRSVYAIAALVTGAFAILEYAFLASDFTFATVASHGAPVQIEGFEPFRSVYRAEESIAVGVLDRRADFDTVLARAGTVQGVSCVRAALVARDYGMHERGEAPQFLARE